MNCPEGLELQGKGHSSGCTSQCISSAQKHPGWVGEVCVILGPSVALRHSTTQRTYHIGTHCPAKLIMELHTIAGSRTLKNINTLLDPGPDNVDRKKNDEVIT